MKSQDTSSAQKPGVPSLASAASTLPQALEAVRRFGLASYSSMSVEIRREPYLIIHVLANIPKQRYLLSSMAREPRADFPRPHTKADRLHAKLLDDIPYDLTMDVKEAVYATSLNPMIYPRFTRALRANPLVAFQMAMVTNLTRLLAWIPIELRMNCYTQSSIMRQIVRAYDGEVVSAEPDLSLATEKVQENMSFLSLVPPMLLESKDLLRYIPDTVRVGDYMPLSEIPSSIRDHVMRRGMIPVSHPVVQKDDMAQAVAKLAEFALEFEDIGQCDFSGIEEQLETCRSQCASSRPVVPPIFGVDTGRALEASRAEAVASHAAQETSSSGFVPPKATHAQKVLGSKGAAGKAR